MTSRGLRVGAIALAALLVLSGCGDDDDETATEGATATTVGGAGGDEFCQELIEIQQSEPEIPEGTSEADAQKIEEQFFKEDFMPRAQRIRDAAPDEIQSDVAQIVDLFEEKGPGAFEDEAFSELNVKVNEYAVDECGAKKVSVTAREYAFEGVPATIESGPVGFFFENAGSELHEMVVLRKNDDTKESFDELFLLDQSEAEKKVTAMGGSFAFPGKKDVRLADLEPGEYAVVCFIPVGLTPEKAQAEEEPEGPPHVARGMKATFTVE